MPSKKQLLEVIAIQTEIAKLGLDLGATMALVVERTLPLIDADGAAIELAEGGEVVYRATAGIAKPQLGLRLKMTSSLTGLCVRTGQTLVCEDSELDPRVDRQACRQVGLRSMIVMPLKHGTDTVGVLKAMSRTPGKFNATDVVALELLSEVVGAAMYYAAKYDADQLFHQATHDALTGLANRALFVDRLRNVIAQHDRDQGAAGVLMIDMDGLKRINDTYGHRAGDAFIKEFANRLKASVRLSDTVARLGGDEFGVILSQLDPPQGLEATVQRIYEEMATPFRFEANSFPLSASIGMAEYPSDGTDIDSLMEAADQRMYQVKHQHCSRVAELRH